MFLERVDAFKKFLFGGNYSDPAIYRRISLTFHLLFYGGIATLILPLVYLAIGFPIGLIFSTLGTLFVVVMLLGIKKGISYIIIGNFCAFSVIIDLGALVVFTGGIFSPALIWLLFAPITGYLLTNNFSGKVWSIVTFLLVLFLAFAGLIDFQLPNFIPQEFWPLVMAINFVLSIGILLLIVFSYEKKQEKVIMKVELLNDELKLKSLETEDLNRNLEKKVERRTEELQRINSELDHFSYSVSHNLRAPLTSILGLVELSKKEPDDSEKYLGLIEESTIKLDRTIHNINSYLKINRGTIEKNKFNLNEVLAEIIQDLSYSKSAQEILIDLQIDQNFYIVGDSERFKMVFTNILSNAIKYSNPEKKDKLIRITSKREGKQYCISVLDNGIGIDKSKHEKIFDMFYRGTEKSQGDGLGLYIVKEALNSINGSIEVVSSENAGANFIVTLPD